MEPTAYISNMKTNTKNSEHSQRRSLRVMRPTFKLAINVSPNPGVDGVDKVFGVQNRIRLNSFSCKTGFFHLSVLY